MASPAKMGFSPGRKLKKLLTQGSDEPENQSEPIDDEATHSGAERNPPKGQAFQISKRRTRNLSLQRTPFSVTLADARVIRIPNVTS